MTRYFYELPVGAEFMCNGNHCIKKSNRTAWINTAKTLWFYFGNRETVRVI